MNKKDETLLPALRFPGFEGDWEYRKLGDFIDDRKEVAGADLPLYSLTIESGIVPKSKRYERSFLVKSEEAAYKRIHPKDFAYNPMNLRWGALACHHGDEEIAVSKYYDVFHVNEKSTPEYLEPFLTSYKMVQFYDRMSEGTLEEKKRVHYLDFIHFKKLFPTLREQRKIANFLTAVDGRIGQLIQKKALLEDYKKGVMQQLFTQALRFKDGHGNDFPDWEEKKLGEFLTFKNGYNAAKEQYGTGKKFINVLDIIENDYITHERIIGEVDISPKDFEKNEVRFGDILFQRSSETREEVGQANVYLDRNETATFGGFVIRGRPIAEFNPMFFNAMLKTSAVRKDMTSRSGGSTRYNIGQESLEEVTIRIAPSVDEQTKIADFLSAIDRKIESVATQITETQTFKRGLLQQMFV
ncbi:MAG: restriction endonuclease subunit S [Verrucomicrobiota bacterium]